MEESLLSTLFLDRQGIQNDSFIHSRINKILKFKVQHHSKILKKHYTNLLTFE